MSNPLNPDPRCKQPKKKAFATRQEAEERNPNPKKLGARRCPCGSWHIEIKPRANRPFNPEGKIYYKSTTRFGHPL